MVSANRFSFVDVGERVVGADRPGLPRRERPQLGHLVPLALQPARAQGVDGDVRARRLAEHGLDLGGDLRRVPGAELDVDALAEIDHGLAAVADARQRLHRVLHRPHRRAAAFEQLLVDGVDAQHRAVAVEQVAVGVAGPSRAHRVELARQVGLIELVDCRRPHLLADEAIDRAADQRHVLGEGLRGARHPAGRRDGDEVAGLDEAIDEVAGDPLDSRRPRRHHEQVVEEQQVDAALRHGVIAAHLSRSWQGAGGTALDRQRDLGERQDALRAAAVDDLEVRRGEPGNHRAVGVGHDDVDDDLVDAGSQRRRRIGRRRRRPVWCLAGLLEGARDDRGRDHRRGDHKYEGEAPHPASLAISGRRRGADWWRGPWRAPTRDRRGSAPAASAQGRWRSRRRGRGSRRHADPAPSAPRRDRGPRAA